MEVVDDWRRQVWTATTADPGYWPEGDFRGPYNGPALNLGARNAGILRPELRDRLRFPFPDETIPADPYPFRPSVGEQLQPMLDQLLGPDVSTALAVARALPAAAAAELSPLRAFRSAQTYAPGIAAKPDHDAGIEMDVSVFNMPPPLDARVPGYTNDDWAPTGSHIEGYRGSNFPGTGKGGPTPSWQVGCSIYLDDTAPGNGNTYVWPRSHLACHRYFSKYPQDIPTGGALCTSSEPAEVIEARQAADPHANREGYVHGIPNVHTGVTVDGVLHTGLSAPYMAAFLDYDGAGPQEAVMNRGDVLIWHHWCAHSGSPNGLDSIRQLFVARFHSTTHTQELLVDDGGVATDGNLWKYWGPAVRGDGLAAGSSSSSCSGSSASKL